MAQIPALDLTQTLGLDDETILRQDGKDVRIQLQLAAILSWAVRWDKQFIGVHTSGITFNGSEEFTVFDGKTYFIKDPSNTPYVSNTNNPSTDTNLTTTVRAKSNHVHDWAEVIYPVGGVYLSMNDLNPSTFLGGTWELVTGDASLALGDGTSQDSNIEGENTPQVPVPQHSHDSGSLFTQNAGSHSHSSGSLSTQEAGSHRHTVKAEGSDGGSPGGHISTNSYREQNVQVYTNSVGDHTHTVTGNTSSAGNHSHTVSGSVGNSGTSGATLDVRGAQLKVNVWRRVA